MVRLKLRTCSTNGIFMKPSRRALSVTAHSLIIVREFDLMQGISEPYSRSQRIAHLHIRISIRIDCTSDTHLCWLLSASVLKKAARDNLFWDEAIFAQRPKDVLATIADPLYKS